MARTPSPQSVEQQILRRIQRSRSGSVFTPQTFTSIGSRDAVDKALQRLAGRGTLRRLSRGLYDKPRRDPLLGELWPSIDSVVKAATERGKMRVQPTGVYAANLLGLSEQVPARSVLLTDGMSRVLRAGPWRIELKHTSPRKVAAAGRVSGLVIEGLRSLGPDGVKEEHIERLRKRLPATERCRLLDDLDLAPAWMAPSLHALASDAGIRRAVPAGRRKPAARAKK